MKPDTPIKELDALRKEEDALDQSVALNRIVMTMLESKRREDFWLRVILIISLLVNIAIAGIFAWYESGWEYTDTTTTTVTQDTGEGSGNNVYQAGENANYIQGNSEEVTPNGETNSNYYKNSNPDTNIQQQEHGSNSDSFQPIR